MAETIKRFITCNVPVTACNFHCEYCYLRNITRRRVEPFILEPAELAERLSVERLGGNCYFNLCADGETMIHPQLVEFVGELTGRGHYADIITNGTQTQRIDELIDRLTEDEQKRLMVKFSFHWHELNSKGFLEQFATNVDKVKRSNISFSVEITPYDKLIDDIEEIKSFSVERFGALPHITVARDIDTSNLTILTRYSIDEYCSIWGQFDSAMFDFKLSTFNKRRKEFCYAGDWSFWLQLGTGEYVQCYRGNHLGNICDDGPLNLRAIGLCRMPHCYNGHAFLAFGDIPELDCPTYAEERDRACNDGTFWLKEDCRKFFSTTLSEANEEYTELEKKRCIAETIVTSPLLLARRAKNMAIALPTRLSSGNAKNGGG